MFFSKFATVNSTKSMSGARSVALPRAVRTPEELARRELVHAQLRDVISQLARVSRKSRQVAVAFSGASYPLTANSEPPLRIAVSRRAAD